MTIRQEMLILRIIVLKEKQMSTIKDIAKMTGYSIGAVSRVINHQKDVSEKARREIEKAVKETGYVPNANAKLLKQTVASAITVVLKGTSNIFLNTILEIIQKELTREKEEVNAVFVNEGDNEVRTAAAICRDNHPKGMIFLGADLDHFRHDFAGITVPSVMIAANGSHLGFDNLSSFFTDDFAGGYAAAGEFIKRGHTKIAVIGGFDSSDEKQASTARLKGAMKACEDHGIPFDLENQYIHSVFSMKGGYEAVEDLFVKLPDVTAVFALSDLIALGVMRGIHDHGFKVPDDISVIGFDGIMISDYTNPRLMTVEQDKTLMANAGVQDLLRRIRNGGRPVHEKIPFHIIHDGSVSEAKNR